MPYLKKAELITGRVYTEPTVPAETHASPCADLVGWLGYYSAFTPNVEGATYATVRLDIGENQIQPDGLLRLMPRCGGRARGTFDDFLQRTPELLSQGPATLSRYELHQPVD